MAISRNKDDFCTCVYDTNFKLVDVLCPHCMRRMDRVEELVMERLAAGQDEKEDDFELH